MRIKKTNKIIGFIVAILYMFIFLLPLSLYAAAENQIDSGGCATQVNNFNYRADGSICGKTNAPKESTIVLEPYYQNTTNVNYKYVATIDGKTYTYIVKVMRASTQAGTFAVTESGSKTPPTTAQVTMQGTQNFTAAKTAIDSQKNVAPQSTSTGVDPPTNQPKIKVDDNQDLMGWVNSAIDVFSIFAGLAIFSMFIFSGYLFLTSQGDIEKVTKARNALLFAVIGIIIIVMAYGIVYYIFTELKLK